MGHRMFFLHRLFSQVTLIQDSHYATVEYFEVGCSEPLPLQVEEPNKNAVVSNCQILGCVEILDCMKTVNINPWTYSEF